jgi:hypothetical protein
VTTPVKLPNDSALGTNSVSHFIDTLLLYTTINQMRLVEVTEAIHDIVLARWSAEAEPDAPEKIFPAVCLDDTPRRLLDAFESLAVVSSESMQHQNYIAVLETFTGLFDRLPNDQQDQVEDRILRIFSALGDHVLTIQLEAALTALIAKLRESKRWATADAVQTAQEKLAQSVGQLNSRATRVP